MTRNTNGGQPVPRPSAGGQSVVEFALFVPILLLLLLGLVDVSMLLSTKNTVAYASRQAARLVEQGNPDSVVLPAIYDALSAGGANPNQLVSVTIFRANPGDTSANPQAGDNPAMDYVYTYTNGIVTSASGLYTDTMRASADDFGVTLRYHYAGMTPFFATGFTFFDVTNAQIDPAGNIYSVATPVPPPTSPPAPTEAPPTPRPTYTPLPTYTQPPTASPSPTPTIPATTAAAQTAAAETATAAALSATPTPTARGGCC